MFADLTCAGCFAYADAMLKTMYCEFNGVYANTDAICHVEVELRRGRAVGGEREKLWGKWLCTRLQRRVKEFMCYELSSRSGSANSYCGGVLP